MENPEAFQSPSSLPPPSFFSPFLTSSRASLSLLSPPPLSLECAEKASATSEAREEKEEGRGEGVGVRRKAA